MHSIKFADINELKQIYSLNNEKLLTSFREIHDCGFNGNKKDTSCMNNKELSCIVNLFEKLNIVSEAQKGYVLGYKSQPIMEQFDILKFVNNYVLNIELKEAGKKLLVQNKNRMMNFLNNSSSGFYVHRKSFLI